MPTQLVLPMAQRAVASLDNFLGLGNAEVVARLRGARAAPGRVRIWLIGAAGAGKTHLLQGALAHAGADGGADGGAGRAAYIDPAVMQPDDLRALVAVRLLAVDAVDALAADASWEASLLQLCNEQSGALLFAAARHPLDAGFVLPDLRSRLAACEIYRLAALDDADRIALLATRATALGIELPAEVTQYLMTRLPRDAGSLSAAIDRLDLASWRTQRRLTVPFVRAVLGGES